MKKPFNTPLYFLYKLRIKNKNFEPQRKTIFAAFYRQPKTMLMVSIETGILRANICRFIAELEKQGRIKLVRKGICPITKHRAGFYTTNPNGHE